MIGEFFRKNYKEIVFVTVIVLCLVLILSTIALLNGYSESLDEQARTKVETYATETEKAMTEHLAYYTGIAREVSHNAAKCQTETELIEYFRTVMDRDNADYYGDVKDIRYFKYDAGRQEYVEYVDGFEYKDTTDKKEADELLALVGKTEIVCTGVVFDNMDADTAKVGFYAPITGSDLVDSMVIYYPISEITKFSEKVSAETLERAEFVVFCSQNNRIKEVLYDSKNSFADKVLSAFRRKSDELALHEDIQLVLGEQINNAETKKKIETLIAKGESDVTNIQISGVSYVIAISGTGKTGGGMYSIGMYLSSKAYESGYQFANSILATLVICFSILIVALLYLFISRRLINKKIFDLGTIDPAIGAPTMLKFERVAKEILDAHKATQFAVILAEVRFFNYITENFGEDASLAVLQYMKLIYSKSLQTDEAYAYIADGQFVLLYHYREQGDLVKRLRSISAVADKYPGLRAEKYSVRLQFGVYEIDRSITQPIQNMVDKAIVAKNATKEFGTTGEIKFYTEKLRENYLQSADIEVRMENALKNDEFKVFFQPKYNIAQSRQDGCEALVRWYEPEKNYYRRPDTFLPLFEANGFIVEVDKYVYRKVCEYIHESVERGDSVYPVSVNVSRITAIQPDFIEYYSRIKRQYKIVDKFLMLEFTESFAFENYDALKSIINSLHQNGFLCSIDDFGSGYSSYNILKELPMDEIKLDKFFIEKGLNEERDNAIIESVIHVAKVLGMKITQEGVEEVEDVRRMRSLGCDVIQGYYYSKPLPMVDYIAFVNKKNVVNERKLMEG